MIYFRIYIVIFFVLPFNFGVSAQSWDINTLHNINQIEETKGYSYVMSETTTAICGIVPLAMIGTALATNNDQLFKDGIYVGASVGVQGLLSVSLKEIFKRPRPYITYPERVTPYTTSLNYSFPSGHTMAAFDLATAVTLKYPKWYVIAPSYVWAASVGYSRMNLGVHYPTDVMAGAAFGAASAYLTYVVNEWFWKEKMNRKIIPETWNE